MEKNKGIITSTSNRQVRDLIQLRKKGKERDERDLFLAEGSKMLEEAPEERLLGIYVSESFYKEHGKEEAYQRKFQKCAPQLLTDTVFEAVSDTKSPQGVLALIRQYHYGEGDLLHPGKEEPSGNSPAGAERQPLCMVLEHLQDPGNLGTILRAGEGAGVTGILLSSDCVDLYNPKVIRSTMGSIFRVPFLYTKDLRGTLAGWKAEGIRLYAAHLQGKNSYDRENYLGPAAFLIGNESRGLTQETAALADTWVRIPMLGRVESLNAAVAASLLMYEAARQRRGD